MIGAIVCMLCIPVLLGADLHLEIGGDSGDPFGIVWNEL